jgi:uncharacterized protein YndB with AHSA1/START domain
MTQRSTDHTILTIERRIQAPPDRVFDAWATPEAKRRWFACHQDWSSLDYALDFRVGGREINRVADSDGVVHAYQALYIDIVPRTRIIYAYDMMLDSARISASLATVTLAAGATGGTALVFTEQTVFLDGYGDNGSRLAGTEILLDRLRLDVEAVQGLAN